MFAECYVSYYDYCKAPGYDGYQKCYKHVGINSMILKRNFRISYLIQFAKKCASCV